MDLVAEGEPTMRRIFAFLEEPFSPACLEPLKYRINSSFPDTTAPRVGLSAKGAVVNQARRLSARWLAKGQSSAWNVALKAELEAKFEMRVQRALKVEENWEAIQRMLARSRIALNVCSIALVTQWVAALAFWLESRGAIAEIWTIMGSTAVLVLVWLRRIGLYAIAGLLFGRAARLIKKSA